MIPSMFSIKKYTIIHKNEYNKLTNRLYIDVDNI